MAALMRRAPQLEFDELSKTLYNFQIFSIVITCVIGAGVFSHNGEALVVAGPGGLLVGFLLMSFIVICVGECTGELVQKFPIYNALVEYTRVFVDPDLGWVVGAAYWYAYASFFATQILAAAQLSNYWGFQDAQRAWQIFTFYFAVPVVIGIINLAGVFWYGWIETVAGFLKILLVVGVSIVLYVVAGINKNNFISDGVQANRDYTSNRVTAVCYTFPIVAYSFLGLESIALTAYEARDVKNLRWPSRWLSLVVVLLYLMCTLGEVVNVSWLDPNLPVIYHGIGDKKITAPPTNPPSTSVVIRAIWQAGYHQLGGFINGCLIFSALSAANTSLYVASRSLFGMTEKLRKTSNPSWIGRRLRFLAKTYRNVPVPAILVSWISFLWVPWLQLGSNDSIERFIQIMSVSGSVAVVMVWGCSCLAYIRYKAWLNKCKDKLVAQASDYLRSSSDYNASTLLFQAQPFVAYVGLLGCIVILAFASTTWWDKPVSFSKVAIAYASPTVCFAFYIVLKFANNPWRTFVRPWTWWIELSNDWTIFIREVERLRNNRPKPRRRRSAEANELPQMVQQQPVGGVLEPALLSPHAVVGGQMRERSNTPTSVGASSSQLTEHDRKGFVAHARAV